MSGSGINSNERATLQARPHLGQVVARHLGQLPGKLLAEQAQRLLEHIRLAQGRLATSHCDRDVGMGKSERRVEQSDGGVVPGGDVSHEDQSKGLSIEHQTLVVVVVGGGGGGERADVVGGHDSCSSDGHLQPP